MITFGELVRSPERISELGRSDVLISASGSGEVVLREKSAGPPQSTMVFMHETIAMMKAERAEQVDKLRSVVGPDSTVVSLAK
ncbi:MAG: hypothetical protein H7Z43_03455, partial [Clostridia bacterium]|nr:hypothetical protein [Deltaproteobacteria bacterium]